MASVPTVSAVGSETELLLQLELARIQRLDRELKLEEMKLKMKEMDHQTKSAPRVDAQVGQTPALEVTTPAQEPVAVQIESAPAESVNQKENFKQWLERVR
jgi:hypothetical protein